MSPVPTRPPRSLWRHLVVGALLPAVIAGVDHVLLSALATDWRPTMWLTVLTMAALVLQIGIMGTVCGSFTDWPWLGWIVYAWTWFLVDVQALLVRQLAIENIFGRNAAFLTGAMFVAQLSLVLLWAVLGRTRWSTRWPVALVLSAALSAPLLDLSYSADNAAMFFVTQLITMGGICAVLRGMRFQLTVPRFPSAKTDLPTPTEDLQESQFGLRHMLIWTTALALVLSLVRLIGLPWDEWANAGFFRAWLVFVTSGVAVGFVLVVAIWSALGNDSRVRRWSLLVLVLPGAALVSGMIEWLLWISQPRIWNRWGSQLDWHSWPFWRDFFAQESWLMSWICLAGAMLFATLLFLRSLGYRLQKE